MAQIELHSDTVGVGAYSGATGIPFKHYPSLAGGVSFQDIAIHGNGAGTAVGLKVVTFNDPATGGTPSINGTIASFAGTIVFAAGVVHKATISTAYWAGGGNIGLEQTSGTAATVTTLSLSYLMGK